MILYRDMTFCEQENCAYFGDGPDKCPRSLTKRVRESAARWWAGLPGDPPIMVFTDTPDCFSPKETETVVQQQETN